MKKQLRRFLSPRYQNLFLNRKVKFKPRYGHGLPPHEGLYKIIDANRETYMKLLRKALSYKKNIWTIQDSRTETDHALPVWNNGFLPALDMIGIYTMLSRFKPKRYVEIGSGHSTRIVHKAIIEQELSTEFISIDPKPRKEIEQLPNRIIRRPFEDNNFDIAAELSEKDILFVDNSHRILPNSDALIFFLEILPRLKRGVIVHIHDVYLPYDYPQFLCDRFYSEQYGLASYLLANPDKYETLLPGYFISQDEELSRLIAPIWNHKNLRDLDRQGASYWIRIAH